MPTRSQPAAVTDIPRRAQPVPAGLHSLFAQRTRPRPTGPVLPTTPAPVAVASAAVEREWAFWLLSATARVALMRRGELTLEECCAWAARAADEVPLLDGEFEFIATHLADHDPD